MVACLQRAVSLEAGKRASEQVRPCVRLCLLPKVVGQSDLREGGFQSLPVAAAAARACQPTNQLTSPGFPQSLNPNRYLALAAGSG